MQVESSHMKLPPPQFAEKINQNIFGNFNQLHTYKAKISLETNFQIMFPALHCSDCSRDPRVFKNLTLPEQLDSSEPSVQSGVPSHLPR